MIERARPDAFRRRVVREGLGLALAFVLIAGAAVGLIYWFTRGI